MKLCHAVTRKYKPKSGNIPYLPEYKSHPNISHTLYFCGEMFDFNFERSISHVIGVSKYLKFWPTYFFEIALLALFKLKTDGIAHSLCHHSPT